MRTQSPLLARLLALPVLTLMLACAPAARAAAPSGTYGAVFTDQFIDQDDNNGGAILALINFDGAGNLTGTYTIQVRDQGGQTLTGSLSGTYSANPDGTGTATINFDLGFSATFAFVVTDGGQGLQFVDVGDSSGFNGGDASFQGSAQSLTGSLPIAPFLSGATGSVPLTFTGSTPANGGVTIYTAASATAGGTKRCDDGSTGPWNALVSNFTMVVYPPISALSGAGGPIVSGTFLGTVSVSSPCNDDIQIITGPVTGTVRAGGSTSIIAHKVADVVTGTGRIVAPGVAPNGAYGFRGSFAPYPQASVGLLKFDGGGNLTGTLTIQNGQSNNPNPPQPVSFTGTYSLNPDGSGTIATQTLSGQPGPTFAFVVTDGGSGILVLQTTLAGGVNISIGTARLQ